MAKILLQGIAYDEKSSFMTGPALAPPLIRSQYRSDAFNFYAENGMEISPDIFTDAGDFTPSEYIEIEDITINNLNNNLPIITLGGDHSISYPLMRAVHGIHGELNVLHIDAHADLYEDFEGDRYSHACPFARIMEDGLAKKLVQVGIRTMTASQQEVADRYQVRIIPMKSYSLDQIPEFDGPVYISLDLDGLDPAFAPGVSHHEPGGFSTRQVLDIIQKIKAPIVGADIVEYNPKRDLNDCTAVLCAKFLKEISAKMLENN